jgi:hypothetical protein
MTKLTKPIVRQTEAFDHADPIVVTLYPRFLTLRLKGAIDEIHLNYADLLKYGRRRFYGQTRKAS